MLKPVIEIVDRANETIMHPPLITAARVLTHLLISVSSFQSTFSVNSGSEKMEAILIHCGLTEVQHLH